jgi:hypothetical protein
VFQPEGATGRAKFARLPSEPGGRFLAKRVLEESAQSILKESMSGRLAPLAELIPLKRGKLVSGAEGSLATQCELFDNIKVSFRSSFICNLSLVRELFPANIQVDARDWLTTCLRSCAPNARYCNFGRRDPHSIFKVLFADTQKSESVYRLPDKQIVVDDLHLALASSQGRLRDLF